MVPQARKIGMNFSRFPKEKLLPILINRTAIFFFLMCLLTLSLYFAGTVQEFVDTTQFTLLTLYTVLGIFLSVTSASGATLDLGRFFKTKKTRYIIRAGGYVFLLVFGVLTVLLVVAIVAISGGGGLD